MHRTLYIKIKEKINKKKYIDVILLLVLSAVPFLRNGIEGYIRPLDSYFPIYPLDYYNRLTSWYETGAYFGNDGSFTSIAFKPFYIFPAFLDKIGIPPNIVNRLTYIVFFFALGYSAYYMVSNLIKTQNRTIPLISALFYMYNPFIVGYLNLGHWYTLLSYASLPFMLTFLEKALKQKEKWPQYSTLIGFLSIFVIPRVRIFPEFIQILGIYLLIHYLINRNEKNELIHMIKIILGIFLTSIMFNAYWILPSLTNVNNIYNLLTTPPIAIESAFHIPSAYILPWNILFLVGYGIPMNEYGQFYYNPIIITLFITLIIFISYNFVIKNKKNETKYFLVILVTKLSFIFLISQYPKFVEIYITVRNTVITPLDLLFFPTSLQYTSIAILLAYTYLIGNTLNEIITPQRKLRAGIKKIVPVLLLLIILTTSKPTFLGITNDFLTPINVPDYYDNSREWLLDQEDDFRVMVVPHSYWLFFIKHEWAFSGVYDISEIIEQVTPAPIVSFKPDFGYSNGSEITNLAYETLTANPKNSQILDLLNIKYILIRNDVIDETEYPYDLIRDNYINEKTDGKLEYYENEDYLPIIFTNSKSIPVYGNLDTLYELSLNSKRSFNSTTYFLLDQMNLEKQKQIMEIEKKVVIDQNYAIPPTIEDFIESNNIQIHHFDNKTLTPPIHQSSNIDNIQIKYEKKSPERYIIKINTSNPIFINLNMLYNNKWIAKRESNQLPHYKSNSFANCWYLESSGIHEITIEYPGWRMETIGEIITSISIIGTILSIYFQRTTIFSNESLIHRYIHRLIRKTDPINKYVFNRVGSGYGIVDAIVNPLGVDRWLRYKKIRDKIGHTQNSIILDVGPGSEGISTYLETQDRSFVILDIDKNSFHKNKNNGILADGKQIPIKNNAFSLVTSLDTLEHIPQQSRKKFVNELKRVSKKKIICSTVIQSLDGEYQGKNYDLIFQNKYKKIFGVPEKNTKEHIECGHPTKKEINSYFPKAKVTGYQNAVNWKKYMLMQYNFPFGVLTGLFYYIFWKKDADRPPFWGAIIEWEKEKNTHL